MRWKDMTPEERDQLVAKTFMQGLLAPYTQDLNATWKVVEELVFRNGPLLMGQDPATYKHLLLHLMVSSPGGRAEVWYGSRVPIVAPPAQAICLAALATENITFEDGQEIYDPSHVLQMLVY